MRQIFSIVVDVTAIAGLAAMGVGADQLGQRFGCGHALAWLWAGGVVLAASVLVASQAAKQNRKRI